MRLTVLIADDEPLARDGIAILLREGGLADTIWEARNGAEAVACIRANRPDLVFLDVQMPTLDGFGVVEHIGARHMPGVVFVTVHDKYAIRAFEVSAVDYLLKPVSRERFRQAFERARERIQQRSPDDSGREMLALLETIASPRKKLKRLAIRVADRTVFVNVEDIDWIDAAENYVQVHTGASIHMLHVPMNTMESSLDPENFLRIHRSIIVNVKRIKQLWPLTHGQFVVELSSGTRLQTGRTYHERVKAATANPF